MRLARDGYKYTGTGPSFAISLGGAVTGNLIIYGTLDFMGVDDPTVTQAGSSYLPQDLEVFLGAFGAGVAYYFMPLNLYVSGTVVGTDWTLSQGENELAKSKLGLGLAGQVGKEWWVSENWALGFAGRLAGASMKDDLSQRWNLLTFAFLFSSTYN
jgi:hypothetical protein